MDSPEQLDITCSCPPPEGTRVNTVSSPLKRLGTRILIVDDAENMRMLLAGYLEGFGYEDIESAGTAYDAFERMTADPDVPPSDAFDLILMDITMPGMDGIEACRQLKTDMGCKDVPVIMVTNHVEPEYLKRAFEAGAMDYVNTPFNRLELQVRVNSALKLKQALDAQKSATNLVKDLLEEREMALQAVQQDVKTLHGLLPICASCKKIRNGGGGWSQLEAYISEHSEAEFSHGICPDCHEKLYPKIYGRLQERGLLPL